MSTTRTLKDKFKAAQEVTSLASTDKLLVVNANGVPGKISRSNFNGDAVKFNLDANAGGGKWIRVATLTSESAGLVFVTNGYWNTVPAPMALLVVSSHSHAIDNAYIAPLKKSTLYPKARIVYQGGASELFLELYVKNLTSVDPIIIHRIGDKISLVAGYSAGEIPAGWSSKEFDLTVSVAGGGKSLPFNYLRNLAERRVA